MSVYLSMPELRFLWHHVSDGTRLPVLFAVNARAPDPTVHLRTEYYAATSARLIAAGYAFSDPSGLRVIPWLQRLLRALIESTLQIIAVIDVKHERGAVRHRVLLAGDYGTAVVRAVVSDHDAVAGGLVELTELGTRSTGDAVMALFKPLVPGLASPFRVPTLDMERAVRAASGANNSASDREAFVNALRGHLGPAEARNLYDLARYGGQYSATFSAAARGPGGLVSTDHGVTVRETQDGRHYVLSRVVSKAGVRTTLFEPATARSVRRRLDELLDTAGRCAAPW